MSYKTMGVNGCGFTCSCGSFHQRFSYQGSYLTHLLYFLLKLDVYSQSVQLSKRFHSDDAPLQIANN